MKFEAFDAFYVERLRSGDRLIEQHFVDYFTALIQLKLRRRLRSASAIEDVRQETFARVWAALRSDQGIRQPQRLGSFVNSVCNNVLFEHYRQTANEVPTRDDVALKIADPAPTSADAILECQMRQKVHEILSRLSERNRLILQRVFLEECDKDKFCRELGVSREYLRVLLCRSRKSFKVWLLKETKRLAKARCARSQFQMIECRTAPHPLTLEDL